MRNEDERESVHTHTYDTKLLNHILKDIHDETIRAVDKFGEFASYHEGYAVLLEEVDELWEEIKAKDKSPVLIYTEARQVAAMACKIMSYTRARV